MNSIFLRWLDINTNENFTYYSKFFNSFLIWLYYKILYVLKEYLDFIEIKASRMRYHLNLFQLMRHTQLNQKLLLLNDFFN